MTGATSGGGDVLSLGERVRRGQQQKPSLSGIAGASPCPSRVTAVLGFPEPTVIPCGDVAGHHGRHHYEITWANEEVPRG